MHVTALVRKCEVQSLRLFGSCCFRRTRRTFSCSVDCYSGRSFSTEASPSFSSVSPRINVVTVGGDLPRSNEPSVVDGVKAYEDEQGKLRVDFPKGVPPWKFFRGKTFNVTDLVVPYCELRRVYSRFFEIPEPEDSTEAKAQGSAVHNNLEKVAEQQLAGNLVQIDSSLVKSREEAWALKILGQDVRHYTLLTNPNAGIRELYVFGCLDGRMVTGYIDQITVDEDGAMVVHETKTRRTGSFPAPSAQLSAYHQLVIYHKLLQEMRDKPYSYYKQFYKRFGIDEHLEFSLGFEHAVGFPNLHSIHQRFEPEWPSLSDKLVVHYIRSNARNFGDPLGSIEFEYDEDVFTMLKSYSFSFWEGARPPVGVAPNELAKCGYCEFRSKCGWYSELTK